MTAAEAGVMWPQPWDTRVDGHPGSRKRQGGVLRSTFPRKRGPMTPRPQTPGLQDCETTRFYGFRAPSLGLFVMAATRNSHGASHSTPEAQLLSSRPPSLHKTRFPGRRETGRGLGRGLGSATCPRAPQRMGSISPGRHPERAPARAFLNRGDYSKSIDVIHLVNREKDTTSYDFDRRKKACDQIHS